MLTRLKIFLCVFFAMFLSSCAGSSLPSVVEQPEAVNNEAPVVKTTVVPHNIALLLPLKGDIAPTSQAIKNGFLAAYYQAHEQNPDLNINVIDTSGGNINTLYQQAIAKGADIIVGPLTKPEVEQLSNLGSLQIPTIALNTLDNYSRNSAKNFYQFGLSPQDEVAQVAAKMRASGLKTTGVIAPEGAWGEKIVAEFRDKYESQGGQIVAVMDYAAKDNLTSQVCKLITANPDEMCVSHKNKAPGEKISIERRSDIDSLFIVATPQIARQIVPLLKFYYAGGLPVFSISAVYSGNLQPSLDQDINGVLFCDIPWVLPNSTSLSSSQLALRKQLQTSWPDSYNNYPKLYGLGVDSFMLAVKLHELLSSSQSSLSGVTGKLSIDSYNHIYRELEWAQFRDGTPVATP